MTRVPTFRGQARACSLLVLGLILIVALVGEAWAKRAPPKPVTPAVHGGAKFVAPNRDGREGKVEAYDEKSGKKLWEAVVYKVAIDPNLEADVQWVFITGLAIRNNALLVTNEKGERFVVDLKTRTVEKVKREEPKEPSS